MPGADRTRLLMITAWGAAFIAALTLSPFAPAILVALLIPVAGAIVWLAHAAEERTSNQKLLELGELIEDPDNPHTQGQPTAIDPDEEVFESIRERVITRNQWIADAIDREVESGAMLRAYLNAIDTPVIATRESGRIAMMNRPARRLFRLGASDEEARTSIEELISNQDVLDLHARAAGSEACQNRVRLNTGGQARFFEVSAIPVRLSISDIPARVSQRRGVVLTFRDVHDLAQTLQLRTDFAANASHELRTPIASIKTAIETMQGPAADDDAMQQKLRVMIENNIIRLEETVTDLLDLSRLEDETASSAASAVDAIALCDELVSVFEQVCERRRLLIEFDLDPRLSRCVTDRSLLLLVLRNLIDNATKFSFEGTTVRVVGEVLPSGTSDLDGLRFRVTDQGVGIPLKHQNRIFERFFQVDESRARIGGRRGSGLGLAIVRHALRSIDGDIAVDSIWQEGTTMTVTIPRSVVRESPTDQSESGA